MWTLFGMTGRRRESKKSTRWTGSAGEARVAVGGSNGISRKKKKKTAPEL